MKFNNIFASPAHKQFLATVGIRSIDVYCKNNEIVPLYLFRVNRTPYFTGKVYGNRNLINVNELMSIIKANNIIQLYYQPYIFREDTSQSEIKQFFKNGFIFTKEPQYPTKTLYLNKNSLKRDII